MKNFNFEFGNYERDGRGLEFSYIGGVDKNTYNLLALKFLEDKNVKDIPSNEVEQFEEILKLKEKALTAFSDILDYHDMYIGFKDSMALVEKSQIGDPANPQKTLPKLLLKTTKSVFSNNQIIKLKFFTATGGTHLDVLAGVDCFIKMYDSSNDKEMALVTIDVTGRDKEDKNAKADIVISLKEDTLDSIDSTDKTGKVDENLLKFINETSFEIAQLLAERYKETLKKEQ